MEPRWGAFALAFLLAGCSSPREDQAGGTPDGAPGVGPAADSPTTLRFASGDYEGTLTLQATFSSLDACFVTCTSAAASQSFDLTSVVPESAPVELAIVIDGTDGGMGALLVYEQASASRESATYQGNQIQMSATVVRDPGGTVAVEILHFLPLTPSPEPVEVTIDVRSVVRADQLLPHIPASVRLTGGDTLAFSGFNVTQAIILGPGGIAVRSQPDDLNLTLPENAPAGTYTVLVEGGSAVVSGPNATMTARRLETVLGPFQPLPMGTEVRWEFTTPAVPLQVGVIVRSQDNGRSPSPFMGTHTAGVTAPDGSVVAQGEDSCDLPYCQGGFFTFSHASPFMDERLVAGTYSVNVMMETGESVETAEFYVAVL